MSKQVRKFGRGDRVVMHVLNPESSPKAALSAIGTITGRSRGGSHWKRWEISLDTRSYFGVETVWLVEDDFQLLGPLDRLAEIV
jgi:hypothetical protein